MAILNKKFDSDSFLGGILIGAAILSALMLIITTISDPCKKDYERGYLDGSMYAIEKIKNIINK